MAILKLAHAVPTSDQTLIRMTLLRGLECHIRAVAATPTVDAVVFVADAVRRVEAMIPKPTTPTDPQVPTQLLVQSSTSNQRQVRHLAEPMEKSNITQRPFQSIKPFASTGTPTCLVPAVITQRNFVIDVGIARTLNSQ